MDCDPGSSAIAASSIGILLRSLQVRYPPFGVCFKYWATGCSMQMRKWPSPAAAKTNGQSVQTFHHLPHFARNNQRRIELPAYPIMKPAACLSRIEPGCVRRLQQFRLICAACLQQIPGRRFQRHPQIALYRQLPELGCRSNRYP